MAGSVQFNLNRAAARKFAVGPQVEAASARAGRAFVKQARRELGRLGPDSTGAMSRSLDTSKPKTAGMVTSVRAGTSGIKYARWVHDGTIQFAPIMPRFAPLMVWDSKVLGRTVAFRQVNGQEANPFLREALNKVTPRSFT